MQRPYATTRWGSAFSSGVLRNVLGCRSGWLVRRSCCKTFASSCTRSDGLRYGPCSRTTTRKPLVESSLANTPPAAPEPITTKSTSSEVAYLTWPVLISFGVARSRPPAGIVPVVEPERRLKHVFTLPTDDLPPDTAAVAVEIGIGIDQET